MHVQFKTALAALVVASAPLLLGAEPQGSLGEPLSAKEVRKAEKNARTSEDHLRLAAWYQLQARQAQNKLSEEEDLIAYYWAQKPEMVTRTKVPNPYWNAQALARTYREEFDRATKLAAAHRKMAESLEASAG
jgi:hypothetical protein